MYCKSCGKNIDNDSKFCTFCGVELYAQNNKTKPSNHISENNHIYENIKYDFTYKKDIDAQSQGVAILIITFLIFLILKTHKIDEEYQFNIAILNLLSFILRVVVVVRVTKIAKQQNRESTSWGLLAFLLPSIALIIIANKKKLFAKIEFNPETSAQQKSAILTNKAKVFLRNENYSDCIRFSKKAIELDENNENTKSILKIAEEKYSSIK